MKKDELKKELAAEEAAMENKPEGTVPEEDGGIDDELFIKLCKRRGNQNVSIQISAGNGETVIVGLLALITRAAEILETPVTRLMSLLTVTYVGASKNRGKEE